MSSTLPVVANRDGHIELWQNTLSTISQADIDIGQTKLRTARADRPAFVAS